MKKTALKSAPALPASTRLRKAMLPLLLTLATAPMLAGCVVAAGPGWHHGYWYHGHHYWYR